MSEIVRFHVATEKPRMVSATDPMPTRRFKGDGTAAPDATAADPEYVVTPTGFLTVATSFTRPADTTAYASGDLVANSTTAGSVTPIELVGIFRSGTEAARIERIRLRKSGTSLTNASFRVHLFRSLPTVSAGDNAAFDNGSGVLSLADIAGHVGTVDVTMTYAATVGARGVGVPSTGTGITCESSNTSGKETSMWALIEARGSYTPVSGETFTLTVEACRS